ncbi:hypothetical protein [Sediminibacterium sp.]|uniref:hypothetical protein n=1 Tax=Sediminibacterium sp. TaxID=1917865 RepID=UPI003F6FA248
MKAKELQLPLANRGVNLPTKPKADRLQARPSVTYAMGFDWIEFTCISDLNGLPNHPFLFSHEHTGHGTKYFNDLYRVETIVHGETFPFAEIEVKPRPSFLDPCLVKVKISNRFCYSPDILESINKFLSEYRLTFKNYVRLDMFVDVQHLNEYGDDIQSFMQHCAARKLVMKGKSMKVHHKRNEVQTITWGSRSSGTSITMYNKTVEMLKKSWKPWIESLWKESGFNPELDTYRLEYSVKKPKTDIVSEWGETIGLFSDVTLISKFNDLLLYYHNTHFQLAINKEGERFSRLQRFHPFIFDATIFRPKTTCIRPQSNNYTKAYIKRLAIDAMFYQKEGNRIHSTYLYNHLMELVHRYSLQKWFNDKFYWLNLKNSNLTVFDVYLQQHMKSTPLTQSEIFNLN